MNSKSAMKIFITGADGFIGSHLSETWVRLGYGVGAFVLYNLRGYKSDIYNL